MENSEEDSKDQKDKQEMLKDVLRRSSKKERQEYTAIVDRQIAIGKRLAEIESEQEELIERFDKNEYPKDMRISKTKERTIDEIKEMSNEELHSWSEQIEKETEEIKAESETWLEKFRKWKAKNGEIISSKMRIIGEAIELLKESHNLEEKEKWLLLSIALKSQPTLMKYMETNQGE
jgi:ElaB/YqjD/DUF883 family membrane-anchored ribosome-binding protein